MIEIILKNLPALIITLPMFAAPAIALFPQTPNWRWFAWFLSFIITGLVFTGSFYILLETLYYGPQSYSFGNWSAPYGIQYLSSKLNLFVLLVLSGTAFALVPFAYTSVENEIRESKIPLFYSCYLLCIAGLFGMVITNDIFNIFVFLEISSLATYALVALGKGKEATKAAFNYLIIGTVGGTFFLLGIAFIYAQTGSLNITDIAGTVRNHSSTLTKAAFVFMAIGMLIKSAVFPLGFWLPRSYQHAPSFVSALIAATATKVALYIFIRLVYEIFPLDSITLLPSLLILALTGMLYGSLAATMQTNVKRLLAFSSVANISYIIFGIAALSGDGLTASLYHYLAHSLAKGGLFIITAIVVMQTGGSDLANFRGMGKKLPVTMACFVFLGLSLIGIPLTPGFISKWYFLNASLQFDSLVLVILSVSVLAVSSLLSAIYMWKIIEEIYFKESDTEFELRYFSNFTHIVLALATLAFGLFSNSLVQYIQEISSSITGGAG